MKEIGGNGGETEWRLHYPCNGHLCFAKKFELFPACNEDSLKDFRGVSWYALCILEEKIETREKKVSRTIRNSFKYSKKKR